MPSPVGTGSARRRRSTLRLVLAGGLFAAILIGRSSATSAVQGPRPVDRRTFDQDVRPVLQQVCAECHNESAPLNIDVYADPASLVTHREGWDKILARLRAGEMPPPTVAPPSDEEISALIAYVERELDRLDRAATPNPGRVTAHRLNRTEYANTVRDLLGVDFRASDEFPADDSGYGFDNIGDVLTVSPALMEKYLASAERIAARAVGGEPLPKPAIFSRRDRVRRLLDNVTQLTQIVDYDADYTVRVNVTGHRGVDDPPVTLQISVDGTPVKTVSVPVQISAVNKQGGGTQRVVQEARVFLTANEHVLRAEFVGDAGLKNIPAKSRNDAGQNIFPESIEVAGPFPPAEPHRVAKKALVCDPASGAACVTRILTTLAHRAYRRPVKPQEVSQLAAIFDRARSATYTAAQSLQFAIATMLVSPQFLFRIERDPPVGTVARLTDVEFASRLSYFLWSSMPDDELLRLAEANRLHLPAVLTAQVSRLIASPKSSAFSENFSGQWLETRSLDAVRRDAKRFPEWNSELREAMRTETRMFFDAVFRENRPISDFIDGHYTFVNERLAAHYGIPGVDGPDFRRVELSTDQRSGVFTQASVLTVSSYPTRTSVVLRGKFLLDNVLNAPPPPPPPDVPTLDEASVGVERSLRAQMEAHRSVPLCASCHTKMDPLGFALENYDAIGRWRVMDGKFPVDAAGVFPNGRAFSGPAEMKTLLRDRLPEFTRGLAEKLLTYATGRGMESYDRLALQGLVRDTAAGGYRFQTLVQAIVKSAPFQQRRGEAPAAVARIASPQAPERQRTGVGPRPH
jgi:hypothetical protein